MQSTHYNSEFIKRKFPITLVCDNVTNAPNIGSLFRISDAFNIDELVFCGEDILLGKRMTKTSRSTENYVNHRIESDINSVLDLLKKKGCYVIALEITPNSTPLQHLKINTKQPIVLILGHENFGISEDILTSCDSIVHINMYGNNSSMNVVQAAGITLYEITKQLME